MLLEDFYDLIELKSLATDSIEMVVDIHPNHDIFKGHFPNLPVTPGVVMLQMLKNGLELHLEQKLMMQSSSQVKFLTLVNPKEQTTLVYHFTFSVENNSIKVKNHTTFKDGTSVLKCNVTFVKK